MEDSDDQNESAERRKEIKLKMPYDFKNGGFDVIEEEEDHEGQSPMKRSKKEADSSPESPPQKLRLFKDKDGLDLKLTKSPDAAEMNFTIASNSNKKSNSSSDEFTSNSFCTDNSM